MNHNVDIKFLLEIIFKFPRKIETTNNLNNDTKSRYNGIRNYGEKQRKTRYKRKTISYMTLNRVIINLNQTIKTLKRSITT